MKKLLDRFIVIGVVLLSSSLGLMAQQSAAQLKVTELPQQVGWFDIQFMDGASAYSLKALMPEVAGDAAVILRLNIDNMRNVARVETVDKSLKAGDLQALIEDKVLGGPKSPSGISNQPTK